MNGLIVKKILWFSVFFCVRDSSGSRFFIGMERIARRLFSSRNAQIIFRILFLIDNEETFLSRLANRVHGLDEYPANG